MFRIVASLSALALTGSAFGAPSYADVAPVFNSRCTVCHFGAQAPNGLRLDTHAAILEGGKNGAAELRGRLEADGSVRATRIRAR